MSYALSARSENIVSNGPHVVTLKHISIKFGNGGGGSTLKDAHRIYFLFVYNPCFIWNSRDFDESPFDDPVRNLTACGTQADGVWDQGAQENILT